MCNGADCICHLNLECDERDTSKGCFFCDSRRTCIIIVNDQELLLCDGCECKLQKKLKTCDPTYISYSSCVPYDPYQPIVITSPVDFISPQLVYETT